MTYHTSQLKLRNRIEFTVTVIDNVELLTSIKFDSGYNSVIIGVEIVKHALIDS